MIITNWTAKLVVGLAGKITPGTVGVTLWPFVFIYPKMYVSDERLIRHEQKHLDQWVRYWIVGFLPLYIYYHIKYGYQYNPLEIEACEAEKL